MTTALPSTPVTRDRIEHESRRAWFRAGVRRRDRRLLLADLRAELDGAEADAVLSDVLGADPARTATDWARARAMADRRLRLGLFALPAMLAAVLAAGGVLMSVADAFTGNGKSVMEPLAESAAGVLAVYVLTAALSGGAILLVTCVLLRIVDDRTVRPTVRALLVTVPVAGVLATAVDVAVAARLDFAATATTFASTAGCTVALVLGALAAGRAWAIGLPQSR